jgi:hypothetical protein
VEITITPLTLLREALLGGNLEMFKLLKDLYESERTDMRKIAYYRAFARAKAEFTPVLKTNKASFGQGKASYLYEGLDDVVDAVVPALSKHGLAHSWVTKNPPNGLISVSCILAHEDGYSEENELSASPDMSGNKNEIQAVISTVTYLQRATLKAKCGLAAGRDDDAQAATAKPQDSPIGAEDVQKIADKMEQLGVSQETFFQVMSYHAGYPVKQLNELMAKHVPFAMRKFVDFEARKKVAGK